MKPTQTIISNAKLVGILDSSHPTDVIKSMTALSAGIPTPTDNDFETVDLNELCLSHPDATILYQAGGESMTLAGINDKDFLIVDTALEPKQGQIIAGSYFGEALVKQYHTDKNGIKLIAHSEYHNDVLIDHPEYFEIIGVVSWVFADKRKFR